MTIWEAALLGLVQGVTEFLPISSSGHLVLFQNFLQTGPESFTVDVLLHFATLFAVVIFFWKDLINLRMKDAVPLAIGTIPAVVIGLLFKDQFAALFASGATIGWELLVTAGINFWSDHLLNKKMDGAVKSEAAVSSKTENSDQVVPLNVTPKAAGFIGLAQAFAIMPAISRSGSTVLAGLLSGLDRTTAFRFSFILSIPAILGANMLELYEVYSAGEALPGVGVLLAGGVTAFVAGILSLFLLRYMIKKAQFEWFGWYCVVLAVVVLYFQYLA